MAAMGHITVDLSDRLSDFLDKASAMAKRQDELERQIQELWRRLHSISEMLEDRDVH